MLSLRVSPRHSEYVVALLIALLAIGSSKAAAQMSGQMHGTPAGFGTASTTASAVNVTGTVLNASNGLPVPRALVRLNDRAVLTDHEGKFEFDQFPSTGNASLQVTKPGFYSSLESDTASNTMLSNDQIAAPIVVRLYPEGLLTGTLTAVDGTPLPQVMVTAQRSVYNETGHQWTAAGNGMTNSRGEFRLPVPSGDYRIETGFMPRVRGTSKSVLPLVVPAINSSVGSSNVIHLSSGTEERFDLHPPLGSAHTVTVHFDPPSERGFPMMTARSTDGTMLPVNTSRNGPDGDMRIELPSGTFTLIANMNSGEVLEYGEATVTVAERPVTGVILRMATVAAIPVELIQDSGSTSDKEQPPSLQQLGLMIESSQDSSFRRGSYSVTPSRDRGSSFRAPPGTYRFTARNSGHWFVKSATFGTADLLQQEFTIGPGTGSSALVVTVSNQTGSVQGSATLSNSPAAVWIYLIPTGPSATPVYSTRSGTEGNFSFANLPPGSYQAIAFETRHSANYRDPKPLAAYATYLHSVTISAGNKAILAVDAVPSTELVP